MSDEAGNLHAILPLCLGARVNVRLTENVWTENGLVNGALGTVRDMVCRLRLASRFAILVHFDKYSGPALYPDRYAGSKVVPVYSGIYARFDATSPNTVPVDRGICDNCA